MNQFYFPHDIYARFDDKILELTQRHSYNGYGVYFALLEYLASQDGFILNDVNRIKSIIPNYPENISEILLSIIELKLLKIDNNNRLYSDRNLTNIKRLKSISKKKSDAGKRGMESRWKKDNKVITDVINDVITEANNYDITDDYNSDITPGITIKYNKNKEINVS